MAANQDALQRMFNSDPALIDVQPALEVLPGMTQKTILTSARSWPGPNMPGGQRRAIAGAAVYEGLAADIAMAEQALAAGDIAVGGCHDSRA